MDPITSNSNTEFFDLHVDNCVLEDKADELDNSTASQFSITLEKSLNLNALIFLKAIECELTLQKFHLGSLPLSTIKSEAITVYFEISTDIVFANKLLNLKNLKIMNKHTLTIPTSDTTSASPTELLDYVNSLIRKRVNYSIIAKQMNVICDTNIMNLNPTSHLDDMSIKLLQKYLEIAIFCRERLHSTLSDVALEPNNYRPSFSPKDANRRYTLQQEARILEDSDVFTIKAERSTSDYPTTVKFDDGINIEISKSSDERTAISQKIKTETVEWLKLMMIPVRNDDTVAESDKPDVVALIKSNRQLLDLAKHTRSLLNMESNRLASEKAGKMTLFHHDFLDLSDDASGQKVQFNIQAKQFLTNNTHIVIVFPNQLSYTLGSKNKLVIGPITHAMPFSSKPNLTNNIMSPNQKLHYQIKPRPSILHFLTDICTVKGVSAWVNAANIPPEHELFYSVILDDSTVHSGTICEVKCDNGYYKIRRSRLLLEKLSFKIVDENYHDVFFAQKTFVKFAFRIRPVIV